MTISKTSLVTYTLSFLLAVTAFAVFLANPSTANTAGDDLPVITVVASGLHNPRGLNFSPNGGLYVAEAGTTGTATTQCGVMGDNNTKCYSRTGSVTRIDLNTGDAERVLTELPSLIAPNGNGNGAAGVHDISFRGMGNALITIGLGGDPRLRGDALRPSWVSLARLGRFNPSGKFSLNEDLGAYEIASNPHPPAFDTNPYGLLALPGKTVYADAGANALIQVAANGRMSTLAVFENRMVLAPSPPAPPGTMMPMQAVPTTVAQGPDGDLYVGQLTGFPFPVGGANVYRVPIRGGTPVVAYTGFTNIIDIAFGPDGSLYVLELARNSLRGIPGGRLVRMPPGVTAAVDGIVIATTPLFFPGGIAIGEDGALYVTNKSTSALDGEVLRIVE